MTKAELLDKAKETVKDRGANYGTPLENFSEIATMFAQILKCPVTPGQVAACMIAVKMCRLARTPNHMDSIVDIAGYAACWAEVAEAPQTKPEGE